MQKEKKENADTTDMCTCATSLTEKLSKQNTPDLMKNKSNKSHFPPHYKCVATDLKVMLDRVYPICIKLVLRLGPIPGLNRTWTVPGTGIPSFKTKTTKFKQLSFAGQFSDIKL